ncbi:MAG: hypothetical protein U1F43_33990 [Myxococcota bacterium]
MTDTTTPRPTTAPDKASLLTALDRLPHGARLAHVARLGRDGVDRPGLAALVDALLAVDGDGGDTYEGLLGVTLAQALGDLERVARARSHPSIVVAARAIGHLLRMPESDAALRVAVLDAPPAFRPRLLAGIVRTKRASLAAALFPLLVARGDGASAGRLLPLLSPEARRAALPAHAWQARGWPLLVRAEPALCAAILADELTRAGADVARVWRQRAGLVGWLAELAPAELFPLLERWLDGVSVAALAPLAKPLLRHDANRLIALAAEPGLRALMTSIVAAGRGLRRLDDDQLARLGRLATSPAELVPLFEAIGWRRRATLFEALWPEAARAGRDDFPVSLLALLPAPLRHREAARLRAIPALAAAADTARALLALSPLGLAEPELRRLARSSDANVRGAHMAALVTAATRERTPDEVLAFLAERIRNDQDPVRQLVFIALADARPSAWTEASAPLLAGMVADACRARDTSHATRLAMQRLAQRLLRNFAGRGRDARVDAAMQMLVELAAETHGLALPKLEKEISQAVASELFAALEATASASTQLEKCGVAVALAQSLGRRAFGIERLQALLERLALDGNHGVAAQAIPVWMADPARREARVERLLAKDPRPARCTPSSRTSIDAARIASTPTSPGCRCPAASASARSSRCRR